MNEGSSIIISGTIFILAYKLSRCLRFPFLESFKISVFDIPDGSTDVLADQDISSRDGIKPFWWMRIFT